MSTNPPPVKMMLVNCIVNQTFNFVPPPNMNPPVMRVMMCSRCHVIQPLRPQSAESITCDVCKFITFQNPDPHRRVPWLHCPKRAVICGISYRNSSPGLKGSIDDAKNMKNLLIKRFGFPESAIFMLTDKETDPWKTPTKNNLLWALNWLGQGCQPKDSLVFHYSGHGLRLRNYRLREVDDGYNETLCPMDFETEGMIFDDEINRAIVERLPPEVKLHAIIDSCHRNKGETDPLKTPTKNNLLWALNWLGQSCRPKDSLVFHYSGHGSRLRNYRLREVDDGYNETLCPMDFATQGMIFDDEINRAIVEHLPRKVKLHAIIDSCHRKSVLELPFLYRKNRNGHYEWEDHSPRSGVFKGTSGGDAISFSGSVEVPTSADKAFLSKNISTGSMTSCFIKAIEDIKDEHKRTYRSILDSMENTINKNTINKTGGKLKQASQLHFCGSLLLEKAITGIAHTNTNIQEPLLSACGPFDVNSKLFTLFKLSSFIKYSGLSMLQNFSTINVEIP
ncbi:metacaspase-1 [Cinnamomum micranthum f. kanehirae]|uniref:Metacaspase-1 n=1 Tax=Cinnamomum micranthum f. kanehirae TaxID=337451 RepID=A0A3S4P7R6_9MAGN|nr:metacaspase-1 [Cinnamomum micranthum f. kanehirae]